MPILDWLNKRQALQAAAAVPYRLIEVDAVHGDPAADNWLIQGDNLDALKALLPFHAGRVKCIYIDPPYTPARPSSTTTTTSSTASGCR